MVTSKQAYTLCFRFLVEIWQADRALYDEDLPKLLGSMQAGLDAALEVDWRDATLNEEQMTVDFAFQSMLRFLAIYIELGEGEQNDISRVVNFINSDRETAFNKWIQLNDNLL